MPVFIAEICMHSAVVFAQKDPQIWSPPCACFRSFQHFSLYWRYPGSFFCFPCTTQNSEATFRPQSHAGQDMGNSMFSDCFPCSEGKYSLPQNSFYTLSCLYRAQPDFPRVSASKWNSYKDSFQAIIFKSFLSNLF